MRPGAALLAAALLAWPAAARAEAPSSPAAQAAAAPGPGPPRGTPDYGGRGPAPTTAGDVALWVPRLVLAPAYLVTEYLIRWPLSVVVPAAERADLPRKVYDLLTFGPEHKAGIVPVGFVDFNFNPSAGVYAFWDDAGLAGHSLRLHAEAWPTDWMAGSITERLRLDPDSTVQLRVSAIRRPDRVFYGLGPSSLQASQSRYGENRLDAGASFTRRLWRSSSIQTGGGVRFDGTYDGHYGSDPGIVEASAAGAFPLPPGFAGGYTDVYDRVTVALDTRASTEHGSGLRLELGAEQGSDVHVAPASGWVKYGSTLTGLLDLDDRGRVVSLSATALFVDPLGGSPVPFTELVYLGGDHPMAGYYAGRLVDRSAAVATLGYSWPVGPFLDGTLRLALGNVFGEHLSQLDPGLLRFSGALGVAVGGLGDAPIELLVGVGSETFAHGGQVDSLRVSFGVPHNF